MRHQICVQVRVPGSAGQSLVASSSWKEKDVTSHMEDWKRHREARPQSILLASKKDHLERWVPTLLFQISPDSMSYLAHPGAQCLWITSFPLWYGHFISICQVSPTLSPREKTDKRQEILKPQEGFKPGASGPDFSFRCTALALAVWRMFRLHCSDKVIILLEKLSEFYRCVACVTW